MISVFFSCCDFGLGQNTPIDLIRGAVIQALDASVRNCKTQDMILAHFERLIKIRNLSGRFIRI